MINALFICAAMSGPYHSVTDGPEKYIEVVITTGNRVAMLQDDRSWVGTVFRGNPSVTMYVAKWSIEEGRMHSNLQFYPLDSTDRNAVIWHGELYVRGNDEWVKSCPQDAEQESEDEYTENGALILR